jgi:hypothetical protein
MGCLGFMIVIRVEQSVHAMGRHAMGSIGVNYTNVWS